MLVRYPTLLIVVMFIFGHSFASVGRAGESSDILDRQQFQAELVRLEGICKRLSLASEAEICRTWLSPDRTDIQRLYLPGEFPKETGRKEIDSWRAHFITARKRYAQKLFLEAKSLVDSDESAAYRRLWQVMREDPDHADAKKALGTMLLGLTARPQSKPGIKIPELTSTSLVPRWQSPNFQLYSRASSKESSALVAQLERFHVLWTQFFYEMWAAPGTLKERMKGANKAWPDTEKIEVMLLANRSEYLQLLGSAEENIGASVGYYNPVRKLSIFYPSDDLTETIFHEMTHQLFSEASSMKMAPVLDKVEGAWCIEGVALYMESLVQSREGWTVGGLDSKRLQTARYRALRDEHWALFEPFCKGSLQDWKSASDIALTYSHATGLTYVFLDNLLQQPNAKSAYFDYIKAVYEGNQNPKELLTILGGGEQAAQTKYRQSLTVTDAQLKTLGPAADSVKQLVLSRSILEDWKQLEQFKDLRWLDVSFSNIQNEDVAWLPALANMERLNIESTKLDGTVLPQIAKLRKLTELDLSLCNVDDASLAWLVSHPSLETLYLTGTKVTEKSLATLSTLPKLKSCDVRATVISKDAWQAFVEKNPRLKK
jgi:hypothetical protein